MSEETPNEELDLDLSDPTDTGTDFDPTADPTLDLDLELGGETPHQDLDLEV